MCNEHTHIQNMCDVYEQFEPTYSNDQSDKCASNTNMHDNETTKLPNTQYKTHTAIKLHGETIPMTILEGLLLDLATPCKFGKIHQCRTAQFIFYVDGTDPCSPVSLKLRNRIV